MDLKDDDMHLGLTKNTSKIQVADTCILLEIEVTDLYSKISQDLSILYLRTILF